MNLKKLKEVSCLEEEEDGNARGDNCAACPGVPGQASLWPPRGRAHSVGN